MTPAPGPAAAFAEQDPYRPSTGVPQQGRAPRGQLRGRLSRWVQVAAVLGAKLKLLLVFGTALLSVVVYATAFGWALAVGFVALLAIHELGHVLAMRIKGFPASPPYFIPFLGAIIFARRMPRNAAEDAFIGAGGPVTGTAASWLALALHALTGREVFAALAVLGFLIHLFNLIPVSPLDGGRVLAFARWWIWLPALALLLFAFTYNGATHGFGLPGPVATVILLVVASNLAAEARAGRRRGLRARRGAAGVPAPAGPAWDAAAGVPTRSSEDAQAVLAAREEPAVPRRGLTLTARLACLSTWVLLAGASAAGLLLAVGASPGALRGLGL